MRAGLLGVVALTCGGCGWMFPEDNSAPAWIEDLLGPEDSPCEAGSDDAHLAATADDPAGGPGWELWVVDQGDDVGAWVIAQIGDGDVMVMATSGCLPARDPDDEVSWFGTASDGSSTLSAGRLPEDADSVQLDGQPPVAIGADHSNFFLAEFDSGRGPSPTEIEALDADGNVIATWEQP